MNIIELYQSGKSIKEICDLTGKHESTIHRFLNKNNITKRNKILGFSINSAPLEMKNYILELYFGGKSATRIAKILNLNHSFVLKFLSENKISKNPKNKLIRKYEINEEYFDIIDSERKAYFLGLLFADGCNSPKYRKVVVSLQEEDRHILEEFSNDLFKDKPLELIKSNGRAKNQYRFSIYNKHISNKLEELGCLSKKSLILEFPKWLIDPELQRHFIRGYFDGDGSINSTIKNSKKTPTFSWSIVSTKNFCDKINDILKISVKSNFYYWRHPNNITYTLSSGGNIQVQTIMDWIYKDSNIFLQRKYDKYLQLLQINGEK